MQHTLTKLWQWVVHPPPDASPPAALLIRLVIGGVFVGDGLLKWLLPVTLGVGRFSALGIPAPVLMAPLVGGVELVGGLLFLLGWCTRLAAIPLLLDLVVAILATIISQWLGTSRLPPLVLPPLGVPALLYDFRADVAQLLGTILLFFGGAGPWAVDALMARRRQGGGVQAEPAGALDGPVSRCGAMDVAPGLLRRTHIAIRTGDHGQGRPEYAGPRGQTQTEEAPMTPDATADGIAALVEGVTIQDALVHHRQALAWGQQVCTQLLQTWTALEAYEPVAYEDKVAGQLHVLDEATKSLGPLHQRLVQARRMLHRHCQHLQRRQMP